MKNSKGFSLLELLVVIAILGILVAVALPRYFDAVDDAKKNAQRTNIAIIKTSLEVYRNKNNKYPADIPTFNSFLSSQTYFSETPVCPYNNLTYSGVDTEPTTWDAENAHELYYTVSTNGKSYTLTYTVP
ncbi:MAG TPA: prepilin-type N-terminal cleavage/methylation domain-containing protein [Dictyoglomaceae bacterium]|nr:prepilin-type N-terminal cleavage/methylation domain-containing protein [Dictyoglomaceae bacterium]HOL39997.1 prepilin-type N-terminal cleavage/methylation domain-containing protein [Dictyoglomaceae bacterium]